MKRLSDCRVLLVDDAKANLDILVEGLKADHKLSLALNGETALQVAARMPPDLVLLDIVMPGMDGLEASRVIKLGGRLKNIPRILMVTAVIFFLPSCLLGMISPVVVKLALKNLEKTGNVVGKIYAFSTLGSILGTFATGFYLISWMGTRYILLTMGIILIFSALIFGGFFRSKRTLALFFLFLFLCHLHDD
jgi:predicted membrane-bound spermidine synthase